MATAVVIIATQQIFAFFYDLQFLAPDPGAELFSPPIFLLLLLYLRAVLLSGPETRNSLCSSNSTP